MRAARPIELVAGPEVDRLFGPARAHHFPSRNQALEDLVERIINIMPGSNWQEDPELPKGVHMNEDGNPEEERFVGSTLQDKALATDAAADAEASFLTAAQLSAQLDDPEQIARDNVEADLLNRFTHHPPQTDEEVVAYQTIRRMGLDFARLVDQYVPDSREKSLAITKIEEAVMWANAGIARNGTE